MSQTAPARTPGVAEITGTIRAAIVSGEFAPNQRLIEADLSDQYGASRATIRAALFELASEGLVDRMPNRGARVRAIPLEEAIEILEVRSRLEALCAAKVAASASDAERDEFRALRAEIEDAIAAADLFRYSQLHQRMDELIRAQSGHGTAVAILERLRAQGVRHQFRLSFQPGRAAVSAPQHLAIIDAIVDADPERAERAVREHLADVIEATRALS